MTQSMQSVQPTGIGGSKTRGYSVNKQIFYALLRLASAALLIRVMGMFNQVIVTDRFGAGAMMDAYFVSSSLPLLLSQLVISAIEFSVIPVYARVYTQGTKEEKVKLFSTALNLLIPAVALLTILMLIFRQQVIFLTAPALDPFRAGLAANLAPFTFPALLLMVIIGYLETILNTEGQFGWPAYAGLLVPLTTALFVLFLGRSVGVVTLCIGMLAGLVLQLGAFLMRVQRAGLSYQLSFDLRNTEIMTILVAAWPAFISAFIGQISPLVDQIFASSLPAGSISALSYSLKLVSVASGVIFVSIGRAALPYLSRQVSNHDMKAFKETLRLYLWITGLITLALTAFMLVFSHPLVRILFQRGAFTPTDTDRTANTLIGFVVGLTPMAFGFVMAKAFGALGKTRLLMGVTIFMVFTNAILDFIFARLWQEFGIALATSGVYLGTMFILFPALQHMIGRLNLLTPPPEFTAAIRRIPTLGSNGPLSPDKKANRQRFPFHLLASLRQQFARFALILAVFAAGIAGIFLDASYTLRIAFGSLIVLAFFRYRYVLLIAWVLLCPFIGSSLKIFSGNNFLTLLTAPTLLLLVDMSISKTFKRVPTLVYLLVYLVWAFASIGISAIGVGPFLTLWITLLDYVAVGVLAIHVLTTRKRVMGLIDAMLLVSCFISLYGIYGYITGHNIIIDPYTRVSRIISIFSSAPSLALLLSITIPLAVYRIFTLEGHKRIGLCFVTGLLLVALALTFTRTTIIVVPLSIFLMLFFLPSRKMRMRLLGSAAGLGVLILLLATVAHVPILGRFFNGDIATLNGRTYLWQAILAHFDPTQLLGKGLEASDLLLANLQVSNTGMGVIATAPHNLFLGALYDHGIIGLILLILVFIRLFADLFKGLRTSKGEHRLAFATAFAIFVSVLLQCLESDDLWIYKIGMYFWIAVVIPFAPYWFASKSQSEAENIFLDESEQKTKRTVKSADTVTNTPVRICFISLKFSPHIGGAELQAERQARELQAAGQDVFVVTLRHEKTWKSTEELHGLRVIRSGGIYRRNGQLRNGRITHVPVDIALFLTLWRLRHQYDVIHTFQASSLAAVAAVIGKLTRKPIIVGIQNTGPDDRQRARLKHGASLMADTLTDTDFLKIGFQDWAPGEGDITYLPHYGLGGRSMLRLLRNSDTFYHVSSTRSRSYLIAQGFHATQIVCFPYGVNTEKFHPAPGGPPDPTKPERIITCVARLAYSKGVDVLLHAWGHMMHEPDAWRKNLNPRLRLVGDGAFRPQMERIVTELGIQESVEFLGVRTDVVDLLQQSWAFVLPSRWEGLPSALTEAMACELPCIAARVSGSEDVIIDGVNGLLVEPEQPVELAHALRRIIEDSDLAQRLAQEAYATVKRDYQLTTVTQHFLKLYRRLLKKNEISTITAAQEQEIQQDVSIIAAKGGSGE